MVELILIEITAVPAERSRGRHNPRLVKRKMSRFPTKSRAAPAPPGSIKGPGDVPKSEPGAKRSSSASSWGRKVPPRRGLPEENDVRLMGSLLDTGGLRYKGGILPRRADRAPG